MNVTDSKGHHRCRAPIPRPLQLRPGHVLRRQRRAVRTASDLRSGRPGRRRDAARQVRGRRALGPRPAVATLDQDRADLPDAERETGLLPVARIPDGPLAGEQHHQPVARPGLEPVLQEAQDRSARDRRAGARRRSRQRRARPAGGVLPRFDGDARHSGHGLRPALRVRHLQADRARRLAARAAGSLARPARSVGSRAAGRSRRGAAGLLVRHSRGSAADRPGPAVDAHRDSVRPPGGRLRRTEPSIRCACGPPPRRTTSTSSSSAAATSSARWPRRSPPKR